VVLSVVLFALLLAVLRVNPEIMLNDYPPDIRAKWGPMTERTKRQRVLVAVIVFAVASVVVACSFRSLSIVAATDVTFAIAFAHFVVVFGTFNLLDWLALDCALVRFQPRFIVLPGTQGMAGYKDYRFHFRGFLIGIPLILLLSALLAALIGIFG
jgi:hypothetical protein